MNLDTHSIKITSSLISGEANGALGIIGLIAVVVIFAMLAKWRGRDDQG